MTSTWRRVGAGLLTLTALAVGTAHPGAAQAEPNENGWHDPTRVWPDPVSGGSFTGFDEVFYQHARIDGRSLLPGPSIDRPLRIWVGGDSLSGGPAFGFEELLEGDVRYEVTEEVRLSTGVVTEWYFDWVAHLEAVVAEGGYDVVVLSMGGNDAQRFRGHRDPVGSPEWQERYRERVMRMMAALDRPGRLVVWVGMPPVSVPTLDELPAVVNPLAAAAAGHHARVHYLDAAAVVSPDGSFTRFLPDPDGPGQLKVREGDGVHYTRVGGELLAREILTVIGASSG